MPARSSDREPRRFGAWTEWIAVGGGALLVWLSVAEPTLARGPMQFTAPVLLSAGLLLASWGLWTLTGGWWTRVGDWAWSRGRRYRVHFHREALVYILILVVHCLGALIGHNNMLMLVFGLMAGPFVLGGQVTRMILNRLQVTRTLPDQAVAGQPFAVRLQLANRKPLLSAWMVTAADRLANSSEQLHPSILFARVPPRDRREAAYAVRPARRGVYRFGPVRVGCSFPLGLMERSFELGATESLLVLPRVGRLTEQWHKRQPDGNSASDRARPRASIFDDEFHRLREYRSGDNHRDIHWRTTARRNELMVREYQHHRAPEVYVLLDLWQPAHPAEADLERVELAVSFIATLCIDASHGVQDTPLHLDICGAQTVALASNGHALSLRGVLEELALVQAGSAPDLGQARTEAQGNNPGCRRILVTTRAAGDAALRSFQCPDAAPAEGRTAFEIIHAEPALLAALLEFDESSELVSR